MYQGKTVGVVVPAYNEEALIEKTVVTMPDLVDAIIIVNDGSIDGTAAIVSRLQQTQPRIVLVSHPTNLGLGRSLADGYAKSLDLQMDITAVMAGDAQMDPQDLPSVLAPIASADADYVKGNRLLTREVSDVMPRHRLYGNALLTLLTKFAKLNILSYRVADVQVRPVYGEAKSGIKLATYIPRVSWLLVRLFFWRLWEKYLLRDFHPLVFFYLLGMLSLSSSILLGFWILSLKLTSDFLNLPTVVLFVLLFLFGTQSILFAMWFDMEYTRWGHSPRIMNNRAKRE
jgi:glycosyltransferase involved in cell wall biosynthesis